MGIAALVLGILGLVVSIIPFIGMYALPLAVIAVILGALGRKKIPSGLATAGLILGLLGTAIGGWWVYANHKVANALQEEIDHPSTPDGK